MSRSLLCGHIFQIKHCKLNNIRSDTVKNKHLFFKYWKNIAEKIFYRQISQKNAYSTQNYVPFIDFLNFRRQEAKRSIVIQVQSAHSYKELHAYCNQLGKVNHMFHYTSGVEPLHFILVEFASENDVNNILTTSCHVDDNHAIQVKSPFLWFRVSNNKKSNLKLSKTFKLDVENGTKLPANESIIELIRSSENISDQMRVLYELTKLNDLGFRLRFLTARQIELAVTGMFPDAAAYPFGSSINGYGKLGCDLDLILKLSDDNQKCSDNRLIYQCKTGLGNERTQSQRHMEVVGDLLHLFLPGCSQVRRILQARVPILKYNQQFTDIECDLSMTNMIAIHMSELLYLLGSIDDRVRPLVFTIRRWAHEVGLTNSSPGRWITNFSLTLLVLAFLQRTPTSHSVLPSINKLMKPIDKNNIIEDSINCKFLNDITEVKKTKINSESLETLLFQFFDYYSSFDFATKAISLNEAAIITKPEHNALYIVNPLEKVLNVSKNVSLEELERLKVEFRNAAWTLESNERKARNWGVLSIFASNNKPQRNFYATSQFSRSIEVKSLFEEEEMNSELNTQKDIKYKNESLKNEVENIKKETEERIKEVSNHEKQKSKKRSAIVKRR